MNVGSFNKAAVIWTLCLISIGLSGCMIWTASTGVEVNPSVDKMLNFVLGGLLGLLGRTESEAGRRAADIAPVPVTGPGGGPVPVTETPKDEVAPTT